MKNINGLDARIGLRNIVRIVRITSVLSFVALCGATVLPIYHETNNAEAAAGTATAPTLTFTSTNAIASVSLSVNDVDGTFATSTEAQKAAFSIATNNYSGYTLSLTASSDTTTLNDNSSHTISSIEYDVSATDFAIDTSLNNKWGFIPSHYSSAANTDDYYFPASTSSHSDTLMVTSIANSNNGIDNADNYTIGIGLRADYNIPSGIYTNSTFLIQYVVNPVDFSITYSDDDIAGVGNLPLMQGGSAQGGETIERVTLSLAIPTRTGYTFAGWCLGVLSDNGTTCTGTTFAAGAEFGIDKTPVVQSQGVARIVAKDAVLSAFSLTGYSGGGKKMIAAYDSALAPDSASRTPDSALYLGGRQYALGQTHKHLPEMVKVCGLSNAPVFSPIVVPHLAGMEVTVQLPGGRVGEIRDVYRSCYKSGLVRFVESDDGDGFLSSAALSGRDSLEVSVWGCDGRVVLVSRFDNLGKGASGAAIQNMNIAIGADETEGLVE